ncbi:MAG TPA: hypothetical protein HA255_00415 [Methanosphaera sp.]|nr:hypothetical protein [Methanosphaera sp.]
MTENKRFTNTDNGFIIDYESEQKVLNLYDVVDVLNELNDENTHIKNTITEMYNNERTELGKSTLKQLLNNIGEI